MIDAVYDIFGIEILSIVILMLPISTLVMIYKTKGLRPWAVVSGVFVCLISILSVCSMFVHPLGDKFASKPIIYLYPEHAMSVDVKLSDPERITCDYPEYNDGWRVEASPNGDLKDLNSGKELYCLYYESRFEEQNVTRDGFVVKSADAADFLDEKLKILGLNDKERNEFIIYWLPKLETNKYSYIRFMVGDEVNAVQNLDITPKPETVIRVMMTYKGLDKPITVQEQKLEPAERAGFTVVEWGGVELK